MNNRIVYFCYCYYFFIVSVSFGRSGCQCQSESKILVATRHHIDSQKQSCTYSLRDNTGTAEDDYKNSTQHASPGWWRFIQTTNCVCMNALVHIINIENNDVLEAVPLTRTLSIQCVLRNPVCYRQPDPAACIATLLDSCPGLWCVSHWLALLVTCVF